MRHKAALFAGFQDRYPRHNELTIVSFALDRVGQLHNQQDMHGHVQVHYLVNINNDIVNGL